MKGMRTKTLDDVLAEERYKKEAEIKKQEHQRKLNELHERRRSEFLEKQKEKKQRQKNQKRVLEFLSSFNTEWTQIAFMLVCYSRHGLNSWEIEKRFSKVLGKSSPKPGKLGRPLTKLVERGFLSMEGKRYLPTKKSLKYGIPGVLRMMNGALENQMSSYVFIGEGNSAEALSYQKRIEMLLTLIDKPSKAFGIAGMCREIGISRFNLKKQIKFLREKGIVTYEKASDDKGWDKVTWVGGKSSFLKAKKDKRVKCPLSIRSKAINFVYYAAQGIDVNGLKGLLGYKHKSPLSRLMSDLRQYGYVSYADDRWDHKTKCSEIKLSGKYRPFLLNLLTIREAPMDLSSFQLKLPGYNNFVKMAKSLSSLYYPHSKSFKMTQSKIAKLANYLGNREISGRSIERNLSFGRRALTPLVRDGVLKIRTTRNKHGKKFYYSMSKGYKNL